MSQPRKSPLTNDAEWNDLRSTLDPRGKNEAVTNILGQLRQLGAVCVIVEEEYLDQDFSAAYSAFYSTVFRRHSKLCRRMHFFKEDVRAFIDDLQPLRSASELERVGAVAYLGFIVVRPLPHAPLARAVLVAPKSPPDRAAELLVHANYEVHVFGAKLIVNGIAMTQQDQRVGSCAQAAIWMAGRHFHMSHRGPWFSTVAITDVATKLTDVGLSLSIPSGSDRLTADSMLRALRAMDREPLLIAADVMRTNINNPWVIKWDIERPADIVNRYVDSGIPVILGLLPLPGETVGHAVLATGHTVQELPQGTALTQRTTEAIFCENFLVHDDQRGSNIPLPIKSGVRTRETPYNIEDHLGHVIIPLPKKVFIPAAHAETISWGTLESYRSDWNQLKATKAATLGTSIALGDDFLEQLRQHNVIARTYLTYGWHYKSRMLRNRISDDFKSFLFFHEFPRFVWVTEFGTLASLNHVDARERKIFAHNVVDATASKHWESRMIFHAPGLAVRRFHNPASPFSDMKEETLPISNDRAYYPKVHDNETYAGFPA